MRLSKDDNVVCTFGAKLFKHANSSGIVEYLVKCRKESNERTRERDYARAGRTVLTLCTYTTMSNLFCLRAC